MAIDGASETTVTYEELIQLEHDFMDAENEILRKQYELEAPLYQRRADLVSKIPGFWALVLEQAPTEVDQYIQASDSLIFGNCLESVQIERFEIDISPRSFSLRLGFSPNEWFQDSVLKKDFSYRRAADNWAGYVSEPVKVHWKKGKDPTHGLTDLAYDLWEAKQKQIKNANGSGEKKSSAVLPEHKELAKKLERHDPTSSGFFTLFGFVSERRYVTAEESRKACEADKNRRAKIAKGEPLEDVPVEDEISEDDEVEICPHGADMAAMLMEDVWPNAIKYFTAAQELEDEQMSELDFEEGSDSDEEVDIRALVKGHGKRKDKHSDGESSPPPKSRKT